MRPDIENFDHEMRGRMGRCEKCGAPVAIYWRTCWRCVVDSAANLLGPNTATPGVSEPLPPSVRQALNADDLRHEIQRQHFDARQEWLAEWNARWPLETRPQPVEFTLDRRCFICCEIANEGMKEYVYRPTAVHFRCYAHDVRNEHNGEGAAS